MPKFNINKLRSAGLRYLVADEDGQMWAYEAIPVQENGHWRLADKHLPPSKYGEAYLEHWRKVMRWRLMGREFCLPIHDAPIKLKFNDAPYDIVEMGLYQKQTSKFGRIYRQKKWELAMRRLPFCICGYKTSIL